MIFLSNAFSDCIISGSSNTISANPNAALVNSGITINGSTVFLGGSLNVNDNNTTYALSVVDGATASVKDIKLTGSDTVETIASLGVAVPSSVPAGSNAIALTIERTDSLIEISGTVAAVGGRLLRGAARQLIDVFLQALAKQVDGSSGQQNLLHILFAKIKSILGYRK